MRFKDKNQIIERYNDRLKTYGYDPRTLGWTNGRQEVRFEALTQIGQLDDSTVLDVGCGFGDLYGFLLKKEIKVSYIGYDININLLKMAKHCYPTAKFKMCDITGKIFPDKFDWIFESGVFNEKNSDNIGLIKKSLINMYTMCNRGIAVDFMTTYVDSVNEYIYYTDPKEIFDFCKTLSRRVTIRHDYMPFEFCIYLYKNEEINSRRVFAEFDKLYGKEITVENRIL